MYGNSQLYKRQLRYLVLGMRGQEERKKILKEEGAQNATTRS